MAQKRVILPDKNAERVINDMFTELYNHYAQLSTFTTQYSAATTDALRLKAVAEYLQLTT